MQMIEMKPKIKNVVVRIPEDLHLPLRRKIAEIDTSFQQVILEALVELAACQGRRGGQTVACQGGGGGAQSSPVAT